MKKILSIILNPLVLCFILVISIALIIAQIVQEPTPYFLLSLLGIPTGLLIRYLINISRKKK